MRNVVNLLGRYAICWEASDGGGGPLPNKVEEVSPGTDTELPKVLKPGTETNKQPITLRP